MVVENCRKWLSFGGFDVRIMQCSKSLAKISTLKFVCAARLSSKKLIRESFEPRNSGAPRVLTRSLASYNYAKHAKHIWLRGSALKVQCNEKSVLAVISLKVLIAFSFCPVCKHLVFDSCKYQTKIPASKSLIQVCGI